MSSLATPRLCVGCGVHFQPKQKNVNKGGGKYCNRACYVANCPRGAALHNWKGGTISTQGYVIPGGSGKLPVHRLIAERVLGRPLTPDIVVHHHDEDKTNNANSNLVICDRAYHNLLHARMRVMARGGDPNSQQVCHVCDRLLAFSEFYKDSHDRMRGLHRRCKTCLRWSQKQNRLAHVVRLAEQMESASAKLVTGIGLETAN